MDAGPVYIDPHLSGATLSVQPGVRASPSDHGVRRVSPLMLLILYETCIVAFKERRWI
jgi:hypothetical protein